MNVPMAYVSTNHFTVIKTMIVETEAMNRQPVVWPFVNLT